MRDAGVVSIFLGLLIILTRAPLLLFPSWAMRLLPELINSRSRTRGLGVFAVVVAVWMIWASRSQATSLEGVLFVFGILIVLFAIPALLLFPSLYMNLARSLVPDQPAGTLFGWRLLGLIGVIIGTVILMIGIDAL